jgi:hypothetical protein
MIEAVYYWLSSINFPHKREDRPEDTYKSLTLLNYLKPFASKER